MVIKQSLRVFHGLQRKKKIVICVILLSLLCNLYFLYTFVIPPAKYMNFMVNKRWQEEKLSQLVMEQKGMGCFMPNLDPFSAEVMRYIKKVPKLECKGFDWVVCQFSECFVKKEILATMSNVKCNYRDIIFVNDYKYTLGPMMTVLGANKYILTESDHVNIKCSSDGKAGTLLTLRSWTGNKAGFRRLDRRVSLKPQPSQLDRYNVMILIFDSTSHNNFIRNLPATYKYLKDTMGAFILNKYNILGDGTTAAINPILTGKNELELPDARWSYGTKIVFDVTLPMTSNTSRNPKIKTEDVYVDQKTFIFHEAKKMGYRTAYLEDRPDVGTFQYRYNGFQGRSADHYTRPFFMEASMNRWKAWMKGNSALCIGDQPSYKLLLNLTQQFLQLDGKRFGLTFISDIAHDDINMIQISDEDVTQYLQFVQNSRHKEDTVFIVMADHGFRYGDFHLTYQGVIEERLPFVSIVLPRKMAKERPDAVQALKANQDVLSTPYDLHATLMDILDLNHLSDPYKIPGADMPRGMSLLKPIPSLRTCSEAGILPHWCACTRWNNLPPTDNMYQRVGKALTDFINDYTQIKRDVCALRILKSIEWVKKRVAQQNENGKISYYQTKITVNPGESKFEGTMEYIVKLDKLVTFETDVSRIDR